MSNNAELDQESPQALLLEEAYNLGYHKVKNGCLQKPLKELNAHIDTVCREARGCVDCKKLRCENCERLWAS